MFCPQCGNEAREPYKFCKSCGAKLIWVKKVMNLEQNEGINPADINDWNSSAYEQWKEDLKRERGKSPDEKRLEEIKAGVITTSVGIAVSIFLYFLLTAVAANVPEKDAAILFVVRWVGFIPLLIGLGILFNGLVISKRLVELKKGKKPVYTPPTPVIDTSPMRQLSEPADPVMSDFSVTDQTTSRLRDRVPVESERSSETN